MNIGSFFKKNRLLFIIILIIVTVVWWEAHTLLSRDGRVQNFTIDKATGKQTKID